MAGVDSTAGAAQQLHWLGQYWVLLACVRHGKGNAAHVPRG